MTNANNTSIESVFRDWLSKNYTIEELTNLIERTQVSQAKELVKRDNISYEEAIRIIKKDTIYNNDCKIKGNFKQDASRVDVFDDTIIWNSIKLPVILSNLSQQTKRTFREIAEYKGPIPRGLINNELDKEILIHEGLIEECSSDQGSFQLTNKGKSAIEILDFQEETRKLEYKQSTKLRKPS